MDAVGMACAAVPEEGAGDRGMVRFEKGPDHAGMARWKAGLNAVFQPLQVHASNTRIFQAPFPLESVIRSNSRAFLVGPDVGIHRVVTRGEHPCSRGLGG